MSATTPEEARALLEGPPDYDHTVEQFEIDDEVETEDINEDSSGLLQSMRRLSKNSINIPVRHIIDPIVHFCNLVSKKFDDFLSRFGNPFLIKRLLYVSVTAVILGAFYFTYMVKIPSKDGHMDHFRLRSSLKASLSKDNLQRTSEYFGDMPHFAGSLGDKATIDYVKRFYESLGLITAVDRHDVYLSHGGTNHFKIITNDEVVYESDMQEPTALKNPSAGQVQPPTQMALVSPGEAEGELVYANFGSPQDFEGLDVKGKLVLVKYGYGEPGLTAIYTSNLGAIGMFFMSQKHETEPSWPEGADYPYDAIQQGSVASAWKFPGDLLSPGWPSSMEQKIDRDNCYAVNIPIAAISWKDAEHLLESLKGTGKQVFNDWQNFGSPKLDEWWTGPNPSTKVQLKVSPIAEDRHQIANVFGKIKGREFEDRVLFIGARMDAMCYGSSQLSGLTVLLEVAHALAELQYVEQWRPLRSIYFVAWDGTSHNFAGSTEWVEGVADHLSGEGVAYIDLDTGISGPDFSVQGNPIIDVQDVLQWVDLDNKHLEDFVDKSVSNKPIVGYGNHIAFEAHTGVPTIKAGFVNSSRPVPLDSCFDSVEWMQKFGDPYYSRHFALAEFTSYLALELSDAPVIPLKFELLAANCRRYLGYLKEAAKKVFRNEDQNQLDQALQTLLDSINLLDIPAATYAEIRRQWVEFAELNLNPSTGRVDEPVSVERARLYCNEKLIQANKATLDRNGILFKRNWYKNHLFGPSAITLYDEVLSGVFPGILDCMHSGAFAAFLVSTKDAADHIENLAAYLDELKF